MQPLWTEPTSHLHSPPHGQAAVDLWNFILPPGRMKELFGGMRTSSNRLQPRQSPGGKQLISEKIQTKLATPELVLHTSRCLSATSRCCPANKWMLPSKNHQCQKLYTVAGQPAALADEFGLGKAKSDFSSDGVAPIKGLILRRLLDKNQVATFEIAGLFYSPSLLGVCQWTTVALCLQTWIPCSIFLAARMFRPDFYRNMVMQEKYKLLTIQYTIV